MVEATRHQCYGGVWYSNGNRFECSSADAADLIALRLAKAVPQQASPFLQPQALQLQTQQQPIQPNRELIAEDAPIATAPVDTIQPQFEIKPPRRYRRRDLKTKFHGKG